MSLPTVSCCIFVHNDLEMLRATMIHEARWVDQFCILDLGSDDGTEDFLVNYMSKNDVYKRMENNSCPVLGFAQARNQAMNMATSDWIYSSAANCMLAPIFNDFIKQDLAQAKADVLSIGTINVPPKGNLRPTQIEMAIGPLPTTERHRIFIRNGSGVNFKGYIHEEPYRGEINCFSEAREIAGVYRYHFAGWGDNKLRQQRYAYMLLRALEYPELQQYTNKWWYETHVPQNLETLKAQSAEYQDYVLRTGRV